MATDHFSRFFPFICAGFGLFLAGGVNLFLIRRRFAIRAFATLAVMLFAISTAHASEIGLSGITRVTTEMLVLGFLPFVLLGNRRVIAGINTLVALLHRPAIRFSSLVLIGFVTVVGSIMAYSRVDTEPPDDQSSELDLLRAYLDTVPVRSSGVTTDLGTNLTLREPAGEHSANDDELASIEDRILHRANLDEAVIRRGAANDRSNCHGWVFTGGRYFLTAQDVERILQENGYQTCSEPTPGDLIIYREGRVILHSAIVRYVTEGQPLLVESKWGELGVFLHAVDKSVYGTNYTIYRSSRKGHLLAGLGTSSK